ncbi:putative glycosyl transferase [Thermogutta terrifontis]|uniref:Putative glycosyl transferase n=1 Tax=Thermogutta terrifontis TaxID=1331910 RepID=A0A286RG85_9BACT|nr:glycosyltransferase family 2 protein [Thermogutta terrifontis]ASV74973.1 putative glycosyl transferase [Thermogutta terrifontis]
MPSFLVTVLTAGFNARKYLKRYLEGLVLQDYTPLQIVFVDDGSTDGSLEFIQYWVTRVNFAAELFITLRQENRGPHVAMNHGLRFATGDLILPVDADDMLLPGAVHAFVKAFEDNPTVDLVYAEHRRCDENFQPLLRPKLSPRLKDSSNLLYNLLRYGMFIPAGAYCYRRRCLDYLPNKQFTPEYQAQNLELLLHTAARGRCLYLDAETVELTVRSNSRSRAKSLERLKRKVYGSHRLQREVARQYAVPWSVRAKLEARLLPLELDYYFLSGMRQAFFRAWLKALCLGVASRKHVIQAFSLLSPRWRSKVVDRYFSGYDLATVS